MCISHVMHNIAAANATCTHSLTVFAHVSTTTTTTEIAMTFVWIRKIKDCVFLAADKNQGQFSTWVEFYFEIMCLNEDQTMHFTFSIFVLLLPECNRHFSMFAYLSSYDVVELIVVSVIISRRQILYRFDPRSLLVPSRWYRWNEYNLISFVSGKFISRSINQQTRLQIANNLYPATSNFELTDVTMTSSVAGSDGNNVFNLRVWTLSPKLSTTTNMSALALSFNSRVYTKTSSFTTRKSSAPLANVGFFRSNSNFLKTCKWLKGWLFCNFTLFAV